jgi:peptidoglycan/xylan/chitin deacetylase (PgdA/CDA1 family)
MNVYLTFDVEVWCRGWEALDENFPRSFERYVWGRSIQGDYALPRTLEILRNHELTGVFFVEPLFSARFGHSHLQTITNLIMGAGQDVQLHLHPEWTDEIRPPIIADCERKRQHLTYYSQQEQSALIAHGKSLLEAATGRTVTAFRSGSFAVNGDTYRALSGLGLLVDSSLNECHDHAQASLPPTAAWNSQRQIDGVLCFPVTVFTDGFGRARPAQVGACSFEEMRDALLNARASGCQNVVLVSHNFEMLKPGSSLPDRIVESRFVRLCQFLAERSSDFTVRPFPHAEPDMQIAGHPERRPHVGLMATARRHAEQLARRVF